MTAIHRKPVKNRRAAGMALSSLDEQLMGAICTQLEKEAA
jgi:hypothetical protein